MESKQSEFADRIVRRLRRRTASGSFLPQVDGIRFIAIASVFFFHVLRFTRLAKGVPLERVTDPGGRFIGQGRLGVLVFFALSGFILAIPFVRQRVMSAPRVPIGRYYLRRLTRIEPPYLVAVLLSACVALLVPGWVNLSTLGVLWRALLGLIYANTLVLGHPNTINPPFWTLEIEIQFYVIVPLLALVFAARNPLFRRLLIVGAIAIATMTQAFYGANLAPGQHPFGAIWNFIQYFLCGFLVADLYVSSWGEKAKQKRLWDVVALFGWPFFFVLGESSGALAYVIAPWVLVALFISVFKGPKSNAILGNRWITTIGGMTYSIYLIHSLVIGNVTAWFYGPASSISPLDVLGASLLLIPAVLAVAIPFYLFVEQPCMDPKWVSKLAARFSPASEADPVS